MTYEDTIKEWKKAYTEVLEVSEKYANFQDKYGLYDMRDVARSAKNKLMVIEFYEKYNLKLDINSELGNGWTRVDGQYGYVTLNKFGDAKADKLNGSGKYISWSDDDRQPKNEWLLVISFPTGAYIFGEDYEYQKELFQEFVTELKTYSPDYSDTANKCFYWKLDNAKPIFDSFKDVLKKYQEKNHQQLNDRKKAKLLKELEKLEKNG